MDDLDQLIVRELSKNARTPFLHIAKKAKVSESTIRKRIAALEGQGIIRKYSLVVDHARLGFTNHVFMGVDALPERYLDVGKEFRKVPEIRHAWSSSGDHMFMLELLARDNDHLQDVSDRIRKIAGVTRICPAVVKEALKGEV
ncbi:TPA: Lrp/AsnC family transcriptional regulator [Candidatus Woesearchaeota archaeon]|nr:transcriptional regulator [Verrucomicrobiota bacterium]HIH91252.1 Lrp/AsnC family transcriptional regulator [Candidatus Woesearchaeota archaeon]HII64656.1 Lrp/AsnC family transcriptional regulator [Candidatus Woesearchaeota archaeon]